MKRSFIFLLLVVLFFNVCKIHAQSNEKIKFGIKTGFNFPLMKGENYYSSQLNYKPRLPLDLKYYAGLLLDVPIAKYFGIQTEIMYSTTGYAWFSPDRWDMHITNSGATPDWQENLSFVSIPFLLKLKFDGFAIYAGPQADFLCAAKRQDKGVIVDPDPTDAKKDYQSKVAFSVAGGIEYTFRFGLGLSARYQIGLTNIARATETGLYEKGNVLKNQMIMFGPYFKFGKARKKRVR